MDDEKPPMPPGVYENAPDLICEVALESGDIQSCNQKFSDRLGFPKDDIIDSRASAFFQPLGQSSLLSTWRELDVGGEIQNLEVEVSPAEESNFIASLSATINRESSDSSAMVFLRDISELKKAHRKLERQTERLERSNEELKQFAYLASHDLQEPLRMVASYTQLLARRYEGELDDRADKYINYAVDGAQRMKALLNDLLEYSRVGRDAAAPELHAAEAILDDVVSNLSVRIAESGGVVEYEDLPDIYGDRSQLVRLFQNLIDNGIKFSNAETPTVTVRGRQSDDATIFAIEDNGIGFDPDNAGRIFDVFQRLHERNRFDGTGAGLSIVQKIVDYHDGSISVESEPGKGSCFTVKLPHPSHEPQGS